MLLIKKKPTTTTTSSSSNKTPHEAQKGRDPPRVAWGIVIRVGMDPAPLAPTTFSVALTAFNPSKTSEPGAGLAVSPRGFF